MKNRTEIKYPLSKTFFMAIILFLLLLYSCADKKEGGGPVQAKIIPEKDFVSILSDLYLTDGLLIISQIRDEYPEKDSLDAYIDVIKSYGYTKEAMDVTIEHYLLKKPKRLIKIYDQMLAELTELDTRLSNIPDESPQPYNNEWNGLRFYNFPDPSTTENPEFSYLIKTHAFYSITFTVTIYPFDQSANPRFLVWLCRADSSETGKKYYLPSIKYIKDGLPHNYIVTGINEKNSPVILKGNLYEREDNPEEGERYGRIDNIRLFSSGGI
jgi:hypothetical protein